MIRFPAATVLSAEARARLASGSPAQREAAAALAADDPGRLLAYLLERWQVPRLDSDVRRFVECSLIVDRFDGPFDLRGVAAAMIEPLDPGELLGQVPAGLAGRPLPWIRIGASQYFGDLWLSLVDGQVQCFGPEVAGELWAEASDYDRVSYARFHQHLFVDSGWANGLDDLLEFQRGCAELGVEDERFEDLDVLARVTAARYRSGANVERFLSNRWFNFSRAQLRAIKRIVAGR